VTIGSKSNVHFQSLLPLEVRVPRNNIEPRSPEDTINMKVSEMMSTESNEYPGPDLDSRAEFPELKPSGDKRQIQTRTLTRRKDMQRAARQTKPIDSKINKEEHILSPDLKNENTENLKHHNETKVFHYKQDGNILNFQFVSDKRVKCPTCRKEFKNILRHLQQSGCHISNQVDFSERFKQFTKDHLEEKIRDNTEKGRQNHWPSRGNIM
jgi:hypothetical protein